MSCIPRAEVATYCGSFFYGAALYIIQLLVPLHMYSHGFSPSEIGMVVASPGLARILIHPFAGLVSDRVGERRVLIASFTAMSLAAVCFSQSSSFLALFAVQLLMGVSRAFYWPAMQSYGSRADPLRVPYILGRAASCGGVGNMIGLTMSGYLAMLLGFTWAFLTSAVAGGLALLTALSMPPLPRKARQVKGVAETLRVLAKMARVRQLYTGTMCGFTAALPFALISSFYPVYLEGHGLTKGMVGLLSASYNIGFILLGLVAGLFVERFGSRKVYEVSLFLMGVMMLAILAFPSFGVLIPTMFALGVSTAGPNLLYQTTASIYSRPEERGAAISVSGYGFPFAFFLVPLVLGFVADAIGIRNALLAVAVVVLTGGMAARHMFRLLGV